MINETGQDIKGKAVMGEESEGKKGKPGGGWAGAERQLGS